MPPPLPPLPPLPPSTVSITMNAELQALQPIMGMKWAPVIPGHTFIAPPGMMGGPVIGMAQLDTTTLQMQLNGLTKAIQTLAAAITKLDQGKRS